MKTIKIRGHKRIWKSVEEWKGRYSILKADEVDREYVKIWIYPYHNYSFWNIKYPEPHGETRKRILCGLLDIYDAWKKELDHLNKPYYLKIWLFEPRLSLSQVVCAVGELADFYDHTFYKTGLPKDLPFQNYGKLQDRMKKLSWEQALDEIWIDDNTIGDPADFISEAEYYANRRWVKRKLKGPQRTENTDNGDVHYVKMGTVWIGG